MKKTFRHLSQRALLAYENTYEKFRSEKKTLKKKTQEKQTNKQTKPKKKKNNNTPYHVWELV